MLRRSPRPVGSKPRAHNPLPQEVNVLARCSLVQQCQQVYALAIGHGARPSPQSSATGAEPLHAVCVNVGSYHTPRDITVAANRRRSIVE